ncbi:clostripain-related cysteine peptidase [Oribacterium sp. FC2011]|uniref:clostripain-related cysteine peptidase n=1 Tax=Oribacterium sp. FC2011 TaxID=1408311 RepID=UPI0004E1312D|nr:clostripain-related cysteine peptidase [Oribacterium sp. FC2011]
MKISKAGIISVLAAMVLGISACVGGSSGGMGSGSSSGGNSVTLMVYMIGSDLESINGCASEDINEMIKAAPGNNVHVVLETGGSNAWTTQEISSEKIQRWELSGSGITLKEELDSVRMSDSDTLAGFLKWGNENYPADRTAVILWNHGGGSALGYGYDELYPESMLTLPGIRTAFQDAGGHYAFIGFDACLMSTVETGVMLSDFADYMIASEETEPGTGWDYTKWLSKLEENPGISMEELGKVITQDFLAQSEKNKYDTYTLAMIKLDKIQDFMKKLSEYFSDSDVRIQKGEYSTFASARVRSTELGFGQYEQIDVGNYLSQVDPEDTSGLTQALSDCIVCFETNLDGTNGLAMYYPYRNLPLYSKMMQTISEIGYPGSYFDFFNSFCSVLSIADAENPVPYQDTAGITVQAPNRAASADDTPVVSQYASFPWYRNDIVKKYYPEASIDSHEAILSQFATDEYDCFYWVDLPEKVEWKNIWYREERLLLDDGEKLLFMGTQAHQDLYQEKTDFIVYNPLWFCIGNTVVPSFFQYFEERDDGLINAVHYIPAILNGKEKIQIAVKEDTATREMTVLGYFIEDSQSEIDGIRIPPKAYLQCKREDKLRFPVDSYDYDYNYLGTVLLDGEISFEENEIQIVTIGYTGNHSARISMVLKDIYNNYISTPWVEHKKEDTGDLLNITSEADAWVKTAAPGNDPESVGLPYGVSISYGFKIRNDSPHDIRCIYFKHADYQEDTYADILYEPIPAGMSVAYADIDHYINWDCSTWSMKIVDADGRTNREEFVFNPWVAEEITITWNEENEDFESSVTYKAEGDYKKDIAGYWQEALGGEKAELSDAMAFIGKISLWDFKIENRGHEVITHMYMAQSDTDISEKTKELYDGLWIGGSDLIREMVMPGQTVDYECPVVFDASLPIWALSITDNETALRDAEPMIPFPVWQMYVEDLSGNRCEKLEFRPWETSKIVIKEKTGGSEVGSDNFYECEITE